MRRSNKRQLAFQTFTETPAATPSILRFGITHQPHGGGDGPKRAPKFRSHALGYRQLRLAVYVPPIAPLTLCNGITTIRRHLPHI